MIVWASQLWIDDFGCIFLFPTPHLFHLLKLQQFHFLKSKIMPLVQLSWKHFNLWLCNIQWIRYGIIHFVTFRAVWSLFLTDSSERTEQNNGPVTSCPIRSTDCRKPLQYLTTVTGRLRCCISKSAIVFGLFKLILMTPKSDYPQQNWLIEDRISTAEIRVWFRDSRNPVVPVPFGTDSLSAPLLTVLRC